MSHKRAIPTSYSANGIDTYQNPRAKGTVQKSLVEKGVIDPVKLTPHRDRYRRCVCPKKYPACSPAFGYDYCRGCGFLIGTEGTNR